MILSAIKKLSTRIKNPWWVAKKKYIKFYESLPLDEKTVLLESQHGGEMSGNIFQCVYKRILAYPRCLTYGWHGLRIFTDNGIYECFYAE